MGQQTDGLIIFMKHVSLAVLPGLLIACVTTALGASYRGDYTLGHEVNVFCPQVNAQCYWLGPNSSQAARAQLKRIYDEKKPGLYRPVCVIVEVRSTATRRATVLPPITTA